MQLKSHSWWLHILGTSVRKQLVIDFYFHVIRLTWKQSWMPLFIYMYSLFIRRTDMCDFNVVWRIQSMTGSKQEWTWLIVDFCILFIIRLALSQHFFFHERIGCKWIWYGLRTIARVSVTDGWYFCFWCVIQIATFLPKKWDSSLFIKGGKEEVKNSSTFMMVVDLLLHYIDWILDKRSSQKQTCVCMSSAFIREKNECNFGVVWSHLIQEHTIICD